MDKSLLQEFQVTYLDTYPNKKGEFNSLPLILGWTQF